ncbi:MAG: putative sugar nucleotidyl transferase [Planctomycetota bacterium]|jgi:UDP-N-acetylglucosamine diphosphorylase/glucosamine-1-phosphate N-acetyltransferase
MASTSMVIFDDGQGRFGPMTDLRACFEVRTGMLTTAGRLAAARPEPLGAYWVPADLAAVVAERADAPVNRLPDGKDVLCVNGRWRLPRRDLSLKLGQAALEQDTEHVVAARLAREDAERFLASGELPDGVDAQPAGRELLYVYPWDVLAMLSEAICCDIEAVRILDAKVPSDEATVVGPHPVEVHRSAKLYPNVVLDAERGPIAVRERAVIRPGAVISGPCSIGRDAVIIDHASVKPNTVIGPMCKIGGEVGETVFQGYSNKAHDGHLGGSWVGKWVNFGAGTVNSNLLNTYGEVSMRLEPDGPMSRTGLTFLGAVVGDHVKFAIGTRIMTGTVVGTGAMIATTDPPPTTVRRFAWLTDKGESVFRFDKFMDTVVKVMTRRDQVPSRAVSGDGTGSRRPPSPAGAASTARRRKGSAQSPGTAGSGLTHRWQAKRWSWWSPCGPSANTKPTIHAPAFKGAIRVRGRVREKMCRM